MARWILQCNPERYRLLDALRDGYDVQAWRVAQHFRDITAGDEVAMWISGPGGGVCVLGEVTRGAERFAEESDPYWADPAEAAGVIWHVGIRLGEPLPEMISKPVLAADPDFADALIIRMPGGKNPFPITDSQWNAIVSRIASRAPRRSRSSNPPWAADELILALDLYLRQRGHIPSPRDAQIVELSDLLNRLPIHTVRPDLEKFRNPNGVVLKITNFAALDPRYPGAGMGRGGRLDAVVWDQYSARPDELRQVAAAIRVASASSLLPSVPEPRGRRHGSQRRPTADPPAPGTRTRPQARRTQKGNRPGPAGIASLRGIRLRLRRYLRPSRRTVHRGTPHPAPRPGRGHHNTTGRPRPGLLQLSPHAAPRQAMDQASPTPGTPARPKVTYCNRSSAL